jgi:hypothetical protein
MRMIVKSIIAETPQITVRQFRLFPDLLSSPSSEESASEPSHSFCLARLQHEGGPAQD